MGWRAAEQLVFDGDVSTGAAEKFRFLIDASGFNGWENIAALESVRRLQG
jgi:hypothetical protein